MSFLDDLRRELARVGIRGRLARRIELELADHLACDPHAQLGAPAQIAGRFAEELRLVRTRRSSVLTFAALSLCAAVTVVAGARPAHASAPAGLALLALSQVALVAGVLALLGLWARTPAALRLAQRRAAVALVAGAGVCVAATTVTGYALLPLVVVAAALGRTWSARTLTPAAERPAPELPPAAWAALGLLAVLGVFCQGLVFEGSLLEGVSRAAVEAVGLAAGLVVLGRPLGLRA